MMTENHNGEMVDESSDIEASGIEQFATLLTGETEICYMCGGADPLPGTMSCPICHGHGEIPVLPKQ